MRRLVFFVCVKKSKTTNTKNMKRNIIVTTLVYIAACGALVFACETTQPGSDCPTSPPPTGQCTVQSTSPSGPSQWCVSINGEIACGNSSCTANSETVYLYQTFLTPVYDSEGHIIGCSWTGATTGDPLPIGSCEEDYIPSDATECGNCAY